MKIAKRMPVERAVFELGGATKVAKLANVHRHTVRYWVKQNHVPKRHRQNLLDIAEQNGIDVDEAELDGR